MREEAIRDVLFVKAIEDADPEGKLLPLAERQRATKETTPSVDGIRSSDELARAIAARAGILMKIILRHNDWAAQVLLLASWRRWVGPLVIAAAFILGLTTVAISANTNVVGLEQSFAGLILWNFLVYVLMTVGVIRQFMNHSWQSQRLFGLTLRGIEHRLGKVMLPRGRLEIDDTVRFFQESWANSAGPILAQQLRVVFHLGAAVVAAAAIAGALLWGLAKNPAPIIETDYQWVREFLLWQIHLFQPVAGYLGVEIPAELPPDGGPGSPNLPMSPWITMSALAVLITVIIPRLIFASVALLQSWHIQRPALIPTEVRDYAHDTYDLGDSGLALPYLLCSYACSPSKTFIAWVAAASNRLFGRAGVITVGPVLDRGGETSISSVIAESTGDVAGYALMMNFAARASHKHHGKFIATALAHAAKGKKPRRVLLVLDSDALKKSWWTPNWFQRRRISASLKRWRAFADACKVRVYFKRRSK